MRTIAVSDYTLRELKGTGTSGLLFREKLAAAVCMDRYGCNVIELPEPDGFKGDRIVYRTICNSVQSACIAIPAGECVQAVKGAYELIKSAVHPRLQVVFPVSTVGMEYHHRLKGPAMVELIRNVSSEARSMCSDVEFQALDASRCSSDFIIESCNAAKDGGCSSITLFDDSGTAMPDEFASLVELVKNETGLSVNICVSNSIGMGAACAVYALRSGADGIRVSSAGMGGLSPDSFAEFMKIKGSSLGLCTTLDYTKIHAEIKSMKTRLAGSSAVLISDNNESEADVIIDRTSSIENVEHEVEKLGYELSPSDVRTVYCSLMKLCEKKSSIGKKELEAVIATESMQVPNTYKLVSYVATISNTCTGVANIVLEKNGETLSGSASGDGVVDCAFRAIEQCVGCRYELDDFQIQSVTEGREALGSALVRLRSGGKLYSGSGLSQDICGASINAYISALNKIASEEHQI